MNSETESQSIGDQVIQTTHTFRLDEMKKNNQQLKQFHYQEYYFLGMLAYWAEISPNEQILAFSTIRTLTILNIQNKKIIKEIQFPNFIWKFRFSNDSNFIFIGDHEGHLYQLDIKQDFKQIYKNKVHIGCISGLKIINNLKVLSSSLRTIIVTDVKDQQLLLDLRNVHKELINQLEYDSIKQMIISCSKDKSIKFFQMNGNLFINQQNAHNDSIHQIQLINSNRNLLSSTVKQFKKWKIDYHQQQLKQSKTFIEKEEVYSFFFSENYQILIKTYSNYLLILNNKFKVIKKQKHKIGKLYGNANINQPISLKYLLIPRYSGIQVLKRVQ